MMLDEILSSLFPDGHDVVLEQRPIVRTRHAAARPRHRHRRGRPCGRRRR